MPKIFVNIFYIIKKKPILNNIYINTNNNVYENNLYDTNNINSDKIIIQKNIDNNFIEYNCKKKIKDNNFKSLEENKICKKNIKFNVVKAK